MISEKQLANNYASLWRTLLPTSDLYVRKINLELYQRDLSPINSGTKPDRRGLVNEIAFELYCLQMTNRLRRVQYTSIRKKAIRNVIQKFRIQDQKGLVKSIGAGEVEDLEQQSRNINLAMISHFPGAHLTIRPSFKGCGFLSQCNADLFVNQTLIEVKAGERPFRSIDVRQLLIYCALNQLDKNLDIKAVGLLNPRQGTSFFQDLELMCHEVSGRSSYDLLTEITERLSSSGISR